MIGFFYTDFFLVGSTTAALALFVLFALFPDKPKRKRRD